MIAHRQLHVKRGGLYNCTQCVFNVTKSAILYHHYRYGHLVEEPELRYSEDSVVRAGQREMFSKNSADGKEEVMTSNVIDSEDVSGPPMVWSYNKDNVPSFNKVFKCRYCPHTNRRRHNTVEHERMHSDHPEHQIHRQQQQRAAGSSVTAFPLHPCKRCTYVCNNAGVLASHVKVHSTTYSSCTVGFYDSTIVDAMQIRALEYVLELEKNLILDNNNRKHSPFDDSDDSDDDNPEITRYNELDDPKLKFCKYCPARFFFRSDLKCHIQFHKFRNWKFSCDCCSFTARAAAHITSHEIVHRDEYEQRTSELLASGYPVSRQYLRPAEYPASVNDDLPPQTPAMSPKYEIVETPESIDSQGQRRIKRLRYSEPDDEQVLENTNITTKRRRRSTSVAENVDSSNVKQSPSPSKKEAAVDKKTISNTLSTTSPTVTDSISSNSTNGSTVKLPKTAPYIRQFACDKCPGKFFKATALEYHKTLHGGTGKHQCRKCDYAVSTYGNLIRHESVHRDLPFRGKAKHNLTEALKLKQNTVKSTTDPADATTMPASPPSSPTPTSTPPPMVPALDTTNDDDNEDNDDSDNDDDGFSMTSKTEDFPIDPEFGSIMLGNPTFYYPTTVKNGVARPKRYKCPKCPSAFDKRDQYAVHLTLHGAQDKYQCDKCDYSVRYTANYVQHQRKHARDAEMRRNHEQAAERAKMIAAQEEAASTSRRNRPATWANQEMQQKIPNQQSQRQIKPETKLAPQDTVFRNEISDRQTAYELNAAYGATGLIPITGINENSSALFRCTHCPSECSTRAQLDRHLMHHKDAVSGSSIKRAWKRSCEFCTYRSTSDADLAEHARVHFLRGHGAVLASLAVVATTGKDNVGVIDSVDHVEYHGKRVIDQQERRRRQRRRRRQDHRANCNNGEKDSGSSDDDDGYVDSDADAFDNDATATVASAADDDEPFTVFKDRGSQPPGEGPRNNGKIRRFSPDTELPNVLIDFNDNRTDSEVFASGKSQQYPPTYVRILNNGKRLEFLSSRTDIVQPESVVKKKKN